MGTHWPFCNSSLPLQIGGVGVGVPEPPVGVLGTQEPLLNDSVSRQDVVAAGVDVLGGAEPPVGVLGTHCPFCSSWPSVQVGEVVGGGTLVVEVPMVEGGDSPHLGQKVAVEVIVVVERVRLMEVILPLVTVTGQLVNVVTTISVVTRSDDAGVVVLALLVVLGTQPVPENV